MHPLPFFTLESVQRTDLGNAWDAPLGALGVPPHALVTLHEGDRAVRYLFQRRD